MRVAIMTCRNQGDERSWEETYRENDGTQRGLKSTTADVEAWARGTIDYWNATLRPQDKVREFVSVRVIEEGDPAKPDRKEHDWQKTNLVTIEERGRHFDRMKCSVCGVTGKRPGLTYIKRDPAFKAKKYAFCTG